MKKVVFTSLLVALVCSFGIAYAEQGFITSEDLSMNDVRGTVINQIKSVDKNASLKEIFGIYQNETNKNNVEVFWSAQSEGKIEYSSSTLIRFKSGKWYNTDINEFVKK